MGWERQGRGKGGRSGKDAAGHCEDGAGAGSRKIIDYQCRESASGNRRESESADDVQRYTYGGNDGEPEHLNTLCRCWRIEN